MSHPSHLTSTWLSALIPFCAYKTDLNVSESPLSLPGITFPLCSSFLPTLLDGQLCYKLTLNKKSGQGEKSALVLLIDHNDDRSINISPKDKSQTRSSKTRLNYDNKFERKERESVKIHLNTLSPFNGFGGGQYWMSAVKKMTPKRDFLGMDFRERNCVTELFEECKAKKLVKECGCVPWEMPGFKVEICRKQNKSVITGVQKVRCQRQRLH